MKGNKYAGNTDMEIFLDILPGAGFIKGIYCCENTACLYIIDIKNENGTNWGGNVCNKQNKQMVSGFNI